ncbi:MAG: SDR family NAD(P)-dependent oxidoreductase, partial [Planctomycetaceae bacterium]
LGIDSIRKAQLFGEIGQKYGLSADASVSLDDFRTLRHLRDYMLPRVGGGAAATGVASAPAAAAPSRAAAPAPVAPTPAPVPAAPAHAAAELETFLVDFVVEQTGYPREIVELDADLEGDLGIDSIRKAQLFGEIGQKYGLSADASVSLDDFRTLRHLRDYMLPRVGGGAAATGVASAPAAAAPSRAATPAPLSVADERVLAWARAFAASAPPTGAPPLVRLPAEAAATIAATAASARIEADVLRAALVAPAAALGGLDVALSGTGTPGMVVAFGRAAAPSCRSWGDASAGGTLVGIEGLPGAVLSWNHAGIVLVVSGAAAPPAGGLPAVCALERLAAAGSLAEVAEAAATLAPIAGSIHAIDARLGTVATILPSGSLVDAGRSLRDLAALSVLERVAGDASGDVSIERVLSAAGGAGVRDGLSASATWIAAGVGAAHAGSPRGAWLPAAASAALAGVFQPAAAPQPAAEGVTVRFGLSLRALPAPAVRRSLSGERVAILGGADPAGRALAAALGRRFVAAGATVESIDAAGMAATLAALDAAESRGAVRHLVIAAPFTAPGEWVAGREATVAAGYFACQRWLAARTRAGDTARATLTAVTSLGGDFGLSGAIASPVGGAFSGLFKGLSREYPDVQIRVVDFAGAAGQDEVAGGVVAEVCGDGPVEVGLVAGRRQTVVAADRRPQPAGALAGLAPGSVWIVTGGARGVTAACARTLGGRHGLRLVLVGSTRPSAIEPGWTALDEAGLKALKGRVMLDAKQRSADPRAAWRDVEKSIEIARELEKFRVAGVDARYEICDLADAASVRSLVARVEREAGPVRGIVHGAGWESACKFEKKTPEGFAATFGPKCVGLENILAAVDPRALESVVAFGSTSGRLGGLGQADYSAANDMLAKIVGRLRARAGVRATVFHWHAWDEVGMASRPESRFVLEQFGMKFMPLAEGVGRFLDELAAGLPEAEVLVTERVFCLDTAAPAAEAPGGAPTGSLVAAVDRAAGGTSVAFRLDPSVDVFLTEHRQLGRPLLPAVMGAELLAQGALAAGVGATVAEIRDFAVERPVAFPTDVARTLAVDVAPQADGALRATLRPADGTSARGDAMTLVSGVVSAVASGAADAVLDEAPFPWNPMVYQDDGPMWHGRSFRTLTGLFLDRSGGWGRLESPDPDAVARPRGAAGWTVPVAMLDGAIVACGVYSYILCRKRVEIPTRFERLRFVARAAAGEKCTVRLRFRSQDAQSTEYDLAILGADGRVILVLDGLRMSVLSQERSRP